MRFKLFDSKSKSSWESRYQVETLTERWHLSQSQNFLNTPYLPFLPSILYLQLFIVWVLRPRAIILSHLGYSLILF